MFQADRLNRADFRFIVIFVWRENHDSVEIFGDFVWFYLADCSVRVFLTSVLHSFHHGALEDPTQQKNRCNLAE